MMASKPGFKVIYRKGGGCGFCVYVCVRERELTAKRGMGFPCYEAKLKVTNHKKPAGPASVPPSIHFDSNRCIFLKINT